ncbi:MAG TPA: hypothetical protein VNI52_11940 [Sphingobacteriaceae bacterium]|nr:hypothetical protein [Sphingobacteriaceae bacterium]
MSPIFSKTACCPNFIRPYFSETILKQYVRRYFYDVDRGLSVRADYAIGEKRPNEKRQKGFYLSLGEAF